jgi:hypothetical protein
MLEAQAALGWGVIVTLLTLLGVVYLSQASQMIASGYEMQQLAAELRELQKENTYLEAEVATGQRVRQLQRQAIELGFSPAAPEDIEYLSVPNYPPTPGQMAVTAQPKSPERKGGLVGWWLGLTRGFTGWTRSTAGEGF